MANTFKKPIQDIDFKSGTKRAKVSNVNLFVSQRPVATNNESAVQSDSIAAGSLFNQNMAIASKKFEDFLDCILDAIKDAERNE